MISSKRARVRLLRDSNGNTVFLQQQENGSSTGSSIYYDGSDVILRLTKTGNSYVGTFSMDKSSFTTVGNFTNQFKPSLIGLTIVSTPPENVFSASFDYFRVYTPN